MVENLVASKVLHWAVMMVSSKAAHLEHHWVVMRVAYLVVWKAECWDVKWADLKETLMADKKAYSKAGYLVAWKVSQLVESKDVKRAVMMARQKVVHLEQNLAGKKVVHWVALRAVCWD